MELSRAKGTRDFLPEQKIVRNKVVRLLQDTFERFGFNPLETPIIERKDVLASKYAGGAEILKEMYMLNDQGKRELALRYDLTVPLSRVVAMNKGLRMPFKRYAIGRVFRDGPLKTGRYREFWQCDVDTIGCKDTVAEAELLSLAGEIFTELNLDVVLQVNSRPLLEAVIRAAGVSEDKVIPTITVLDKLEKVGVENVKKELKDALNLSSESIQTLIDVLTVKGEDSEKIAAIKELLGEDKSLEEMENFLNGLNISQVQFTPSLSRGLAYYTGIVFEAFLVKPEDYGGIKSSLAGGGRYDEMIGSFIQDGKEYPAVGISFGLDVISEALKLGNTDEVNKKTVVDVQVISIGTFDEAFSLTNKFRAGGLKVDLDLLQRGVSKNLDYASKSGIPFVVILGKKELEAKKVTVKNMDSGEEQQLSMNDCFSYLKEELKV